MSFISPSWEVISLVSGYLDPQSLAVSSMVCKQWYQCMTSDHLWKSLCSTSYPNLLHLKAIDPTLSYRRLYSLGLESAKRRLQPPPPPRFATKDLDFALSIQNSEGHVVILKLPGETASNSSNDLFRFEFSTSSTPAMNMNIRDCETLKVSLNVILRDWRGVFSVMQSEYKKLVDIGSGKVEGWLTKELPRPGCCGGDMCRGVMTELILTFESCNGEGGGGMKRLERVNIGLMRMFDPSYLQVDDGLRYLENFLI